jgi:hypothetical protein
MLGQATRHAWAMQKVAEPAAVCWLAGHTVLVSHHPVGRKRRFVNTKTFHNECRTMGGNRLRVLMNTQLNTTPSMRRGRNVCTGQKSVQAAFAVVSRLGQQTYLCVDDSRGGAYECPRFYCFHKAESMSPTTTQSCREVCMTSRGMPCSCQPQSAAAVCLLDSASTDLQPEVAHREQERRRRNCHVGRHVAGERR